MVREHSNRKGWTLSAEKEDSDSCALCCQISVLKEILQRAPPVVLKNKKPLESEHFGYMLALMKVLEHNFIYTHVSIT